MNYAVKIFIIAICCCLIASVLRAEIRLPGIFSDHMVLQRDMANPVWGKADPGEKVTVEFAGQIKDAVAGADGNWKVLLDPMPANARPQVLKVSGFQSQVSCSNVLVGEVWLCSGQSNMQFAMQKVNHSEVEIASANYPEIRLITVPPVGTQEPQFDIDAEWQICTPESIRLFSATGYFFGRRLHHALGVPVGLINNAWGGSDIEAWLPRGVLEEQGIYQDLLENWDRKAAGYTDESLAEEVAEYEAWRAAGSPGEFRYPPYDIRTGQKRPANIFNGVLHPTIGYGIRGVIWCQGESNLGRSSQYRDLFQLMITTWRKLWEQGDFPFYWVQLADFGDEDKEPSASNWAEIREAQTQTLALPNTGEAVVIDIGEARDIHPRDKQTPASRLVRHALVKDYGYNMACESPRFDSMEVAGDTATITFKHVSSTLYAFDVATVKGFSICGEDGTFVWTDARIVGSNKVEIRSDQIKKPVAVRYGWADNPVVNLYDRNGLPVTPFRTDD